MKRSLCAAALLAVAAIPDWASACWFGRGPVRHSPPVYAYRPIYCPPVCYPPPPPCVPMTPVLPPPRVEPVKPTGKPPANTDRPPARPSPAPPDPTGSRPNPGDPVRPTGGIGGFFGEQEPRPPSQPEIKAPPLELPKKPDPKLPTIEPPKSDASPKPDPKVPPLELPRDDPKPKLPPLELPKDNGIKLPPLELPKDDPKPPAVEPPTNTGVKPPAAEPKLPPLELPGESGPAVPTPAPAPDAPTPAPKNADALPPLTLPPDTPEAPAPPTVAKSSPITGGAREPKVSVFPASGTTSPAADAAGGLRKVGFFNHTDRDLSLTIEGKAVTLPAKSYIHAQVPPTFTWKHGGKPAATETIPADAAGLDVLFRD